MLKNKSLAYKLSVSILSAVLLIFFLILVYNYYISRKLILKNVQENTKNLTSSAINKSEGFFRVIEKIAQNVSYLIRDSIKSEDELNSILSSIVKNNSEIYGSCLAFAPHEFNSNIEYFAPYYYKKGNSFLYENLARADYFYPEWDWYKNPVKEGKALWSEPYFDEGGGNELMTTYSVPFYSQDGRNDSLIGVITADVSLKWLQEIVSQIKIFETGFAFLISQKGTIITHPDTSYVMDESIFTLAEKFNDPDLKKIGEEMIAGNEDFVPLDSKFHEGKCWIYYTHLQNNDWSLGFVFPENELYADLHKLNQTLIIMTIAGLAFLLLLIVIISNRVTRPLHNLANIAEGFGKGNFELKIPSNNTNDEVGTLNRSFAHMQSALKEYIENLKQTTSAKEKIESELKIAREIQMGMIPRKFPAFPDRKNIDIYGFIEPAKEVGGDLYDFFFIDDSRLCFTIGDVAGKGTPAALFMAITKTILRAKSEIEGLNVSRIIESVNNYLCKNNEGNLFVTLFLGILNTNTGEIEYSNAGHNYPFVIKNNGRVSELASTHCIPLGISSNLCKIPGNFTLEAGDTLFLYSDGISEAFNIENEQYSIPRIAEVLKTSAGENPKKIIDNIVCDVKAFASGKEQSDDISILAIRYLGEQKTESIPLKKRIVIKNSAKDLIHAAEEITALCSKWNIPDLICNRVNLVVEELVLNTISYGYSDNANHEIFLDLESGKDSISLQITDDAKEFNPTQAKEVNTHLEINEREIGGLGIHLVKNLTDKFTYERSDSKNIVRIKIYFHHN